MSKFSWLTDFFSSNPAPSVGDDISAAGNEIFSNTGIDSLESNFHEEFTINPANGLPMIDGAGGIDIEGNPFGTDLSHDYSGSLETDCGWSSDMLPGADDTWGSGGGFSDY